MCGCRLTVVVSPPPVIKSPSHSFFLGNLLKHRRLRSFLRLLCLNIAIVVVVSFFVYSSAYFVAQFLDVLMMMMIMVVMAMMRANDKTGDDTHSVAHSGEVEEGDITGRGFMNCQQKSVYACDASRPGSREYLLRYTLLLFSCLPFPSAFTSKINLYCLVLR